MPTMISQTKAYGTTSMPACCARAPLIGKRRNAGTRPDTKGYKCSTESQELDNGGKEGEPRHTVHDPEHAQADAHPRGVQAKTTTFDRRRVYQRY
jgi:hypothetical protein